MSALWDRHAERERVHNYRAGLIASAIYNVNRKKDAPLIEPMCFFEGVKPIRQCLTAQEVANKLDMLYAACKRKT